MAISIGRLSGGNTPADGSDPRTFPAIWNATADTLEGLSNTVDGLEVGDLTDTTITSPVAGEKLVYDGTEWVNVGGFTFVETVYFTSSGTFNKGDYPWLRAICVKVLGAGGQGGSIVPGTAASQSGFNPAAMGGGGAGGYAESFITDIAGLPSSVTVTRGAFNGGTSSFGTLVSADGGGGGGGLSLLQNGSQASQGGNGGNATAGDLQITGNAGTIGGVATTLLSGGTGGASVLGGAARSDPSFSGRNVTGGTAASGFGSGGSGTSRRSGTGTANGGNGSNGIVIVELYG